MKSHMAIPLQSIDSRDELASLPLLSVVREGFNQSPFGADYGGVWERRRSGWKHLSGNVSDASSHGPSLPVWLLWHPRWRELLT